MLVVLVSDKLISFEMAVKANRNLNDSLMSEEGAGLS